jgi:hypothetical protein
MKELAAGCPKPDVPEHPLLAVCGDLHRSPEAEPGDPAASREGKVAGWTAEANNRPGAFIGDSRLSGALKSILW